MTSRNAEIIDFNEYRKRRAGTEVAGGATELASVQSQFRRSQLAMATALVFWTMWVSAPFFMAMQGEDGLGTA